jgi:hypothetical protein
MHAMTPRAYIFQTLFQHEVFAIMPTLNASSRCHVMLGTGHYLWWGVAPKRNVFRGNNFADPTIKKTKI